MKLRVPAAQALAEIEPEDIAMQIGRLALPIVVFATLLVTGCASHSYHSYAGPPPPPPPGYALPPLIEQAQREGFRMGSEDGARDAYNGRGYRPKSDRKFKEAPGYDPAFGPYQPYRDHFQEAYLRGYYKGYNRA